ncbi:hypothetical protein NXC14_PA00195 (plasmid) [Rhizobium sp. NXC14]|nr:hypothetical protein NXC14_PA00195 [Rhizobium sp. NXC14]
MGLGAGYTAFGDEQIFLNVTNSQGEPYSGLDNAAFLDGLKRTAAALQNQKSPLPVRQSHDLSAIIGRGPNKAKTISACSAGLIPDW